LPDTINGLYGPPFYLIDDIGIEKHGMDLDSVLSIENKWDKAAEWIMYKSFI